MDLRSFLLERERTLLDIERGMGTENTNKAMVAAFYRPLGMTPWADGTIGDSPSRKVYRKLPPFIVSYREVLPIDNELARPFLANPKDHEIGEQQLKRPFVETVIRIRTTATEGGGQVQSDYLTDLRSRMDNLTQKTLATSYPALSSVFPTFLPKSSDLLESYIIAQMMASIPQMAQAWALLQRRRSSIIKDAQIALVPKAASAKGSPFGKQGNIGFSLKIKDVGEDPTGLGRRLLALRQRIAVADALFGLLPTEDAANVAGSTSSLSPSRNVMSNALTTQIGRASCRERV